MANVQAQGADEGFGALGLPLLWQGYPVLPIEPRTKRPMLPGWNAVNVDERQVRRWTESHPEHGVGIRLGEHLGVHLAAIDLDILDPDMTRRLVHWFRDQLDEPPIRIGRAPKVVLLVRCTEPTRKLYSRKFADARGREHRVEVLGEGQQFVAFGTHPNGKPYRWRAASPIDTGADELPEVTPEQLQRLLREFEAQAEAAGWEDVAAGRHEAIDIADYREPMGADTEELRAALATIPSDDYHTWIDYGLALFHEFHGDERGLDLWDEWSAKADNYAGRDALEAKWHGFRSMGVGGTITVRSIFHRAKEVQAEEAKRERQRQANNLTAGALPDLDFMQIPPRRWVLGHRLLAGYVTATFAPGGVAKSTISLLSGVSVALGRAFTGEPVHRHGRVWVINNEDDTNEIYRRLAGICIRYGIEWRELQGRLFVNSGYGQPYIVSTRTAEGHIEAHPNVERIIREIQEHGITYLIIDPFISTHDSDENDNAAINRVVDAFKHIADATGCAIELAHHTRKGGGDSEAHVGNAEAGRGASSLKDAARIAVTLARMSRESAQGYGLTWEQGRRLIRLDDSKANFALPDEECAWFRLESVELPNGDSVGVPEPFDMSEVIQARDEVRERERNEQAAQWRIDIVQAMTEDQMRARALADRLMGVWGTADRATRERIRMAVAHDRERALKVETDEGEWWLWLQQGSGNTSPLTVCRERDA